MPLAEAEARLARAKAHKRDFGITVDAAAQVDCSVCADGTRCDTVVEHGKVTYYFCKGGACSPQDALVGDLD